MDKIDFNDLRFNISHLLGETQAGRLCMMNDNRVLKLFDSDFLIALRGRGYNLEEKILNASNLVDIPEVIVPDSVVYDDEDFFGYTMPYFEGISIYEFVEYNKNRLSLEGLNPFFTRLENIIKKSDNIVFPDLLSDGNILLNRTDIGLIDFDGLQIGEYSSPTLSSSLGERFYYNNTKYRNNGLYTKELDIKSLIYLYFDLVFNCPLWNVDSFLSKNDKERLNEKLEFLFRYHRIDSSELFDKVVRLYDDDLSNIYLGETIYDIASNYELDSEYYASSGVRKLIKK